MADIKEKVVCPWCKEEMRPYPHQGYYWFQCKCGAKSPSLWHATQEQARKRALSYTADLVPKSEVEQWYHEYHAIKDELRQEKMYHRGTEKLAGRYCAELQTAKSEVERLEKALAAKDSEYDQALQDKARECNIAIDKICLEHREEIRRLQESHEETLAKAKREVARKIFADIEFLIDKYSLEPNYLLLHLRKDIAEFKKQHNKN